MFAWGGSEREKVGEDLRPGMDVKCAKVNGMITKTTLRMRMRKSQQHMLMRNCKLYNVGMDSLEENFVEGCLY